jgi:hypothetical protein
MMIVCRTRAASPSYHLCYAVCVMPRRTKRSVSLPDDLASSVPASVVAILY